MSKSSDEWDAYMNSLHGYDHLIRKQGIKIVWRKKKMPLSRIIIWIVTGCLVSYDLIAAWTGIPTISAQIRVVDQETSGLFRWLWLGLWAHFFIMCRWP